MKISLNKKIIIVTGSTQGLGKEIAKFVAQLGAEGIVICGRNSERGDFVQSEINKKCKCTFVHANLELEEDCRKIVRRCYTDFGRVDGLVNAAGLTTRGSLDDTSVDLWDQLFAVNVRAPFILTQDVTKLMKRKKAKGSIVNIISMSSHGGQPYLTAYCSSKGALATLTKNVAHYLRSNRIRVNGINIGWTDTPNEHIVQKLMGKSNNWLIEAESHQPFGRLIKPIDVAKIVAYLLSEESSMITGSVIDFDQNVMGCYE